MNSEADRRTQRETFLAVALTLMGGSVFLFVLFVACGGLAIYVLAVVLGLSILGLVHYVLWGYALSAQMPVEDAEHHGPVDATEPETADEEADPQTAQDWTPEERSWFRRF
jgi:hypothetical protein